MRLTRQQNEAAKEFLSEMESHGKFHEGVCNCRKCRLERVGLKNINDIRKWLKKLFGDEVPAILDSEHQIRSGVLMPHIRFKKPYKGVVKGFLKKRVKADSYDSYCHCCGDINIDTTLQEEVKRKINQNPSLRRDEAHMALKKFVICDKCVKKYFGYCSVCGEVHTEGTRAINLDGSGVRVCMHCLDKLQKCAYCPNHTLKVGGEFDRWLGVDVYMRVNTKLDKKYHLCPTCAGRVQQITCSRCGHDTVTSNPDLVCGRCATFVRNVHEYSFKPQMEFFVTDDKAETGPRPDELTFGFEIELENEGRMHRNDASAQIRAVWPEDYFYCMHDGSLNSAERGLELVSMPCTYRYFNENANNWEKLFKEANKCDFFGDDRSRAGCHIHLNKPAFRTYHLYKFTQFIYHEDLRDLMLFIGNRVNKRDQTYWSFDKSVIGDVRKVAKERYNYQRQRPGGYGARRAAVNVCTHTVELRFFQSTHTVSMLRSYVQFALSAFIYTQDTSLKNFSLEGYLEFLSERRKEYHDLVERLVKTSKFKPYFIK
jgi:hypothetical protein